jgi:hypothetical protein
MKKLNFVAIGGHYNRVLITKTQQGATPKNKILYMRLATAFALPPAPIGKRKIN